MPKVSTNISIDADIKSKSQAMLADFGLDLSTAVNMFLRQMLRERAIPFEIRKDVPNATTLAAMDAAQNDEDIHGPFESISDLKKALNA